MLKSSNLDSVINEIGGDAGRYADVANEGAEVPSCIADNAYSRPLQSKTNDQNNYNKTVIFSANAPEEDEEGYAQNGGNKSLAVQQLSAGLLQIAEPPLVRARAHLKELIGKQNKIYIDLSKEKFKLDCSEVAKLNEMMTDVKLYKDKLNKVKKQMQIIYQRTKDLKKRAANIEACKQREYQRKIEKQHHEESLIGSRQQT